MFDLSAPRATSAPRLRGRPTAGVAVVLGMYAAFTAASAMASPPAGYVPLSKPYVTTITLTPGKAIEKSLVGGKSQIPSSANSVAITVGVAAGTAPGSISVHPRDNEAATFTAVSWLAGETKSADVTVIPGTKNSAVFLNNSTGSVVLTLTYIGYRNQAVPGPQGPPGPTGSQGPAGPDAGGFSLSMTMVSAASEPANTTVLTYGPFTFKAACWKTAAGTGNAILRVSGSQTFSLNEVIYSRLGNGAYTGGPAEGSGLGSAVVELISGTNISGDSFIDPGFFAIGNGAGATVYRMSAHVFEDAPNDKCLVQGTIFSATP